MASSIYRTQLKDKFYSNAYGKDKVKATHFGLGTAVCGAKSKAITLDKNKITCKSCLRRFRSQPKL